jgi:hypothetical protein
MTGGFQTCVVAPNALCRKEHVNPLQIFFFYVALGLGYAGQSSTSTGNESDWLGKPTPRKCIRGTQKHWRERLMPWTAAVTDRLALQMPAKALKKGLFSSCLSPFVLHHFSRSFSVFVFFFLLCLPKVVSLSSHLARIHCICPLEKSGLLIYCRTHYIFKAVMTHYVDWLCINAHGCLESCQ